jgi:hypothetical protein
MFETYKVAVRLSLIDGVSGGLFSMSKHFATTGRDVDALQAKLHNLQKLTMIGAAASGAGIFGLGLIGKAIKPAEEYTHQLNIMNMAGMKQAEIAEAVGAAWRLAGQNMTTTATGNLKALLDLRNITGSFEEAKTFLPIMQRMETVLAASKEGKVSGHSGDLAFSAMKALDIRGAASGENRDRQADMMTRVIEATQGRVTPEMFQSVFNYARQAKFSMSDDFVYKYLPTLMLENSTKGGGGGGSKGLGPALAAMYRVTNQGYINKKAMPLWEQLGEVDSKTAVPTATAGTVVAHMTDAALARSSPMAFNDLIVEKIRKKWGPDSSDDFITSKLTDLYRGNQLAAGLAVEMFIKRANFERDRKLIEGVMSPEDAYKSAITKDPATARRALHASWENFETSLTMNVVPYVVPALNSLSKELNNLGSFARHHPNMTKDLVIGFGALSGVLAVGGPLLTGMALTRLAFGGLGSKVKVAGEAAEGAISTVSKLGTGIGSLTAAAAPLLAMLAVTKWAEDQTHDKERVETLQGWSNKVKDFLPSFMGDPTKSARAKYIAARGELDGTSEEYIRPRSQQPPQMINNTIVMPDGQVLARVVTKAQSKEMNRAQTGISSFDPSMNLAPVGIGFMGGR